MPKIKDYSLYLVVSEEYGQGKTALEIASAAIYGGVDIIQMREKNKTKQELTALGNKLSRLCRENNALFIVNDDPFVTKEVNADGVHLGQEDIKRFRLEDVRSILGQDKIIGISTHSLEQFQEANNKDFDYIAFGPVFPTQTKDYFIGTKDIEEVLKIAKKPVVFIGGINLSNISELLSAGVRNIALIRAILQAKDITLETKKFRQKFNVKRQDMIIKINGKEESIDKEIKLIDLISKKNLCSEKIIIEHNFKIIDKEKWPDIILAEFDNLEIVSFVGGG
ncbi:MAG: thiamine phosphate synthase [Candidatus Omnitrophota bacterium]